MRHKLCLVFLLLLGLAVSGFAQINEGFDGPDFPPTGWAVSGVTLVGTAVTAPHSGSYCVRFNNNGDFIRTPLIPNPGVLTYYHKKGTGNYQFFVQWSTSPTGPWNNFAGYPIFAGNGWTLQTLDASALSNVYIRWTPQNTPPPGKIFYIDTIGVTSTGYVTSPTDMFRTIATGNWDNITIWESSADGINWYPATLKPTSAASMVYLNHNVNLTMNESCGNLTFNMGGSVTFFNFILNITGVITNRPVFYYNGSGYPSNTTIISNSSVTFPNPTYLPGQLNILDINSGANTVVIPNDIILNNLTFTSGSFFFNGHKITYNDDALLNNHYIAFSSANAVVTNLSVSFSPTNNVYHNTITGIDYYSINGTWSVTGNYTNTVNIHFTYPESESSASVVGVWYRPYGSPPGTPWTLYSTGLTMDNGDTRTVVIYGVPASMFDMGALDWTIFDVDPTVPVQLSSFTATVNQQYFVVLNWITQSETETQGFNLYRNNIPVSNTSQQINPIMIQATNTSLEQRYSFTDIDAEPGNWYYWLQSVNMNGVSQFFGPIFITVTDGTGSPIVPDLTSLSPVYPNPFNSVRATLTGSYSLAKAEYVKVAIFNLRGQEVRTLSSGSHNAGNYPLSWDGRDNDGKACTTGIYYLRMSTENYATTRKLMLIK